MLYFKSNEEVIKNLRNRKIYAEKQLSAWENVSISKKKDGSEFTQISRALNGAKYDVSGLGRDPLHPHVEVYFTVNGSYERDDIYAFWFCDSLPKDDPRRCENKSFLRATCPKTADELRDAIKEKIEYLREYIKELESDIQAAEAAYEKYCSALRKAEEELKAAGSKSLYYAVKDAVSF